MAYEPKVRACGRKEEEAAAYRQVRVCEVPPNAVPGLPLFKEPA